jgi:phosphoribosyl 1,2-cyclic phosphate phosphodiesterase
MIGCSCNVCTSTNHKDKRLRSSVLIETQNKRIVIDTTPDFRYQMLRANVKKLDAILITHPHKDHVGGIDDVRAFNFFQKQAINLYGSKQSINGIKNEVPYAFVKNSFGGIPEINLVEINEQAIFYIDDIAIQPIKVWHHLMPVTGYRIGNFTYITDANRIDDAEIQKISGSELLVLNALRQEEHISHFSLGQAITLAQKINANQTYFTHISHQLGLHNAVNSSLPNNIFLGYDGLII